MGSERAARLGAAQVEHVEAERERLRLLLSEFYQIADTCRDFDGLVEEYIDAIVNVR